MKRTQVLLCCRDCRGLLTGKLERVEVPEECIDLGGFELASEDDRPQLRFYETGSGVPMMEVSGPNWAARRYRVHGRKQMAGNVFWDSVLLPRASVKGLLEFCLQLGFAVEECPLEGPFARLFAPEDGR